MDNNKYISSLERLNLFLTSVTNSLGANKPEEIEYLRSIFAKAESLSEDAPEWFVLTKGIETAVILEEEVNIGTAAPIAELLYVFSKAGLETLDNIKKTVPDQIFALVEGLSRVDDLYERTHSVESENYRKLLMSMAQDVRVIIVLICEVLFYLRNTSLLTEDRTQEIAREASYLFSPLAHRLGLYKVKSELEDLSMKMLHHDIYKEIAKKLNETKRSRDQYIHEFIEPLKKKLEDAGFKFHIKGRTKSIYSIWNKIKKQNTTFEHVYDLFAVRVILDTPYEREKSDCWQVYSILTDQYQPNPKRLRDWLSIPKSNGYESLHTTVMGPGGKWVEVQIRTERMDEIAEKGFAAHFKYKGVKGENNLDSWMANIREILENPESANDQVMSEFKMNLYDKEVFIFTPTGDLLHLPKGATILDFAYLIHSRLGNQCVGGRIAGKNVSIRYELNNGDQVEILTSQQQKPKEEWLNIVKTSKAKNRIKSFLREEENENAALGKELLTRRFKNAKIDLEESILAKTIKKMQYKITTEFFRDLGTERLDVQKVKDIYLEILHHEQHPESDYETKSADTFEHVSDLESRASKEDVLTIDSNLKGIQYSLAKCCNPIYGDDIFGFILTQGGIKIHRTDCPNAPQMMQRFGYRYVKARWSGKGTSQYTTTLKVIGNDDIGIVNNITSIISGEEKMMLRSINIDSHDGLFRGNLEVMLENTSRLEMLIKKLKNVKGVKQVSRL